MSGRKASGRGIVSGGTSRLALSRLVEDPNNERKVFRGMDELVASTRAVGVVEPIIVTPDGDKFRILTGHRRFRAARQAGLNEVEVVIRTPDDERVRRQISLVSNIQRESIGPVELAKALDSMIKNDSVGSQRGLAAIIGKTESWVSSVLRILDLPESLQERLRSAKVAVPYDAAARIARVTEEECQKRLVDLAIKGASTAEIRQEIENVKIHGAKKWASKSETVDGFRATVAGPGGNGAKNGMIAAVARLLRRLKKDE